MAEIDPGEHWQADRENLFRDDTDLGKAWRRVSDGVAHTLLGQILSALGGSTNTTPQIFKIDCAVAGTEYSQALPANTKRFIIQAADKNSRIDFAYSRLE